MKTSLIGLGEKVSKATASGHYIAYLLAAAFAFIMLFVGDPAFASGGEEYSSTALDGVVKGVAGVGGAVIAVIMIIMLVKHGMEYAKGSGTTGKMIVDALVLLLMIGLIVVAVNYNTIMGSFGGVATSATETVGEVGTEVLG